MTVLIQKSFRHVGGALAKNVTVTVVARGQNTVLQTLATNDLGTVSFYVAPGQYDFKVLGARIPFDALATAALPADVAAAVAAHIAALDPHSDRAYTDSEVADALATAQAYADSLNVDLTALVELAEESEDIDELVTAVAALAATPPDVTQAELDAEASARTTADTTLTQTKSNKNLPTGITPRTRNFDESTSIYNLHALNTLKTRAKIASARVQAGGTGRANIVILGHSNAAGIGATIGVNDLASHLRRFLEGAGVPSLGTGLVPGAYNSSGTWDGRWGYTSGADRNEWYNHVYYPADSTGKWFSFTADRSATHIELAAFQNNPTWTYQIGTDAPVAVTPTGANERVIITVARPVEKGDRIVLTSTGTGAFSSGGIRLRNGTVGVEVSNFGISGSMADHWRPARNAPTADWYNAYNQMLAFGQPDIAFVMLDGNEALTGVDPEVYRANMQAIIAGLQTAGVEVKLVRIIDVVNDGVGTGFSAITQATWNAYGNVQYDLADQYDIPLLDLTHRFGPTPGLTDPLDFMSDLAHMNGSGYGEAARGFWRMLGEQAGSASQIDKDSTYGAVVKAQAMLTGGGTVAVSSTYGLSWSARFLLVDTGRGTHWSKDGYFDITMPANGTVIPGVGGATSKTVASGVIPTDAFISLYYIPPVGDFFNSKATNFRMVGFNTNFVVPDHWILIAARNDDNTSVRFANGVTLPAGMTGVAGLEQGDAVVASSFNGGGSSAIGAFTGPAVYNVPLTSNTVWTSGPGAGIAGRSYTVTFIYKQPASGGPFTVTHPASLEWAGDAVAPVMPAGANAEMIVHFFWTGLAWRAFLGGVFTP